MMRPLYVQFGCANCAPEEWVNFDASPTLLFEQIPIVGKLYSKNSFRFPPNVRYGNIVAGLPLPDNSVAGLYASHVLEHLSFDHCYTALRNSYRILEPGGRFRLVVPDLKSRAERYLNHHRPDAANTFIRDLNMGRSHSPKGMVARLSQIFGHSMHLWMWDETSMTAALQETGFSRLRRCDFDDADDPMFKLVENKDRFWADGVRELAIEGFK